MGVSQPTADLSPPSHVAHALVSDRYKPTSKYGPSRQPLAVDEADLGLLHDKYYSGHDEQRSCRNQISTAPQLRVPPLTFEHSEWDLEE
jgi:hypothetical protein